MAGGVSWVRLRWLANVGLRWPWTRAWATDKGGSWPLVGCRHARERLMRVVKVRCV
jgi:hypothetical protein